jgi:hypothetical protein
VGDDHIPDHQETEARRVARLGSAVEEPGDLLRRDTGTVVFDRDDERSVRHFHADPNGSTGGSACGLGSVPECVADEGRHSPCDLVWVERDRRQVWPADDDVDPVGLGLLAQRIDGS